MDKTWILKPRNSVEYRRELNKFLDFVFANASSDGMIKCLYPQCGFQYMQTREDAYDHRLIRPFPPGYTMWLHHGEKPDEDSSSSTLVVEKPTSEVNPYVQMVHKAFNFTMPHGSEETTMGEHVEDDDLELPYLYDGPSHEAQDFIDLLADGEEELYLSCSKYSKLSFLVKLYHIKCLCSVSDKAMSMILDLLQDAFEEAKLLSTLYEAKKTIRKLGIEYKKELHDRMIACYIRQTSSDMLWHKEAGNNDEFLRHPRDAKAWKSFDLCMKQTFFILSMIIPGPKMPGNDIDVYLEPLVDELKQLWDGIETYDANKGNTFNMHVALMWTISDFSGLENLSGWNTHSELACPMCNVDAKGHKYRLDRNRFDGQVKSRDPPKKLFGTDVLRQQSNVLVSFVKQSTVTTKKRRNGQDADQDDSP
ncbi:uncharacterized protein LOC107640908 [Arachis ipaensis]|uniref:uncharacterized protein LOC107640908 n=1 Tax=Arachis ipaensis TaxID=130454 RepID=UPI0007AFC98C|nr:uncharacterized protein LOC107640908 [Arachis ipaensis]XP_025652850.1 uncharacterized protein LOC112748823 [Arachis hypogaea]